MCVSVGISHVLVYQWGEATHESACIEPNELNYKKEKLFSYFSIEYRACFVACVSVGVRHI